MQEIVYHTNYELEDNYWWFTARNRIVRSVFEKKCGLPDGATVLDAGCGTGGFAASLLDKYNVICLDTSATALEYCAKRGLNNRFKGTLSDFRANARESIQAISMLDVIEHIEDDLSVVKDTYKLLPRGGYLLATVPAYPWMWSKHDEIHMHYRRYKLPQFKDLLKSAGFSITYGSYFNTLLFPAALLKRAVDKLTGAEKKKDEPVELVSKGINKTFDSIFGYESKIIPGISLPFGLSIICVAKKV
ncbi:MAG: class I SAM-dependent methyltransferase [Candidatus Kapaibacterium sp.]